jgi:aryl-alcohol dehydrogenase-like predicted oxidoreductase
METVDLAPGHRIARVIKGGWQLAGGHGLVDRAASVADMIAFADAGITTFDCADIYTGVEAMIGAFRAEYARLRGREALDRIRVHTKFVPDLAALPRLGRADVVRGIDTSLARLGVERLDLVQFHWWDYAVDRYVETALHLAELRREGKIANIGGTNFDTAATLRMIEAGVPLVSMQVQYSVLDDRPARSLAPTTEAHGLHCFATARSRAGSCLSAGSAPPSRGRRSRTARSPSTRQSWTRSAAGRCSRGCSQRSPASPPATAATSRRWRAGPCSTAPGSPR